MATARMRIGRRESVGKCACVFERVCLCVCMYVCVKCVCVRERESVCVCV